MDKINEILKDCQRNHSTHQIEDFIIKNSGGPTDYGRYKQACREIDKRYRGLKNYICDREKLKFEIETIKIEIEQKKLDIARKISQLEDIEKTMNENLRELNVFLSVAIPLKDKIGELTDKKRDELDKKMWKINLKKLMAVNILCEGRIKPNTYDLILTLEKQDRDELLKYFGAVVDKKLFMELIDWIRDVHPSLEIGDINGNIQFITDMNQIEDLE